MQDEERRRIARELHDSVGQVLAAVSMNSVVVQAESHKLSPKAAKCVAENAMMVEEISTQIRTISHLLHPPLLLLDETGLPSALRWYVEGFSERSKVEGELNIPSDFSAPAPRIGTFDLPDRAGVSYEHSSSCCEPHSRNPHYPRRRPFESLDRRCRQRGFHSKSASRWNRRHKLVWGFAECENDCGGLVALWKFNQMDMERGSPPFFPLYGRGYLVHGMDSRARF